jgi:hypothetical protein
MGEQYVGIDLHRRLHRRRSVLVRMTPAAEVLEALHRQRSGGAIAGAGQGRPDPEVVLEATYGWYWAAARLAPPAVRELRELVRYRAKLVALRSSLKAQVHAALAKQGLRCR